MIRRIAFILSASCWMLAQQSTPSTHETIQVTSTKVEEDANPVPVAITVISGDELRLRNAHTLDQALSMVSGVVVAPGGDGGPAGTVPELWGLREFDAFLLVVDGVPWGGAFNPALTSVSLENVERIEVMRGPAPAVFGATSFVGVIQVIHRDPENQVNRYSVEAGSYGSGGASLSYSLPPMGNARQSLSADVKQQGFKDERTQSRLGHVMYRLTSPAGAGRFHLDGDVHFLRQDPASPHPRKGTELTDLVARDSNFNPSDAALDQNRFHLAIGYDRPMAKGTLTSTLALTHSTQDNTRGFLSNLENSANNAAGYTQDVETSDLYVDIHWSRQANEIGWLLGVDYLAGKGEQRSQNFRYTVPLDAQSVPSSADAVLVEETEFEDERGFAGIYAQAEWKPTDRFRVDLGTRLNLTDEKQEGEAEPIDEEGEEPGAEEGGMDSKSLTRLSGVLGMSYNLVRTQGSGLWVFADYRNTFKPAALDFGPEAESEILKPETAESIECGLKWDAPAPHIQLSAFSQVFNNLVVSQAVNGLPQLVNAGQERFQGAELEGRIRMAGGLILDGAYSYHDAKFRNYERLFDGVPFQLDGHSLELSARNMASVALMSTRDRGFNGRVEAHYMGRRYLDKRNRAVAPDTTTLSAIISYRTGFGDIRLEGRNLTDRRDPVAESELGDAQYYLLPARSIRLNWSSQF